MKILSIGIQKWNSNTHTHSTLILGKVWPPVKLVLVVGHVGLTSDGRGSAVWQGASHRRVRRLLRGAVHAVELRSTWEKTAAGGSREPRKSGSAGSSIMLLSYNTKFIRRIQLWTTTIYSSPIFKQPHRSNSLDFVSKLCSFTKK